MSFLQPETSKDLPLLSNTDDILAKHYMLNLSCDFKSQIFSGWVIIFLEPVGSLDTVSQSINKKLVYESESLISDESCFQCILDCCDINIETVEEVNYNEEQMNLLLDFSTEQRFRIDTMQHWISLSRKHLSFKTNEWGLYVWKTGVFTKWDFPRVLFISYSTTMKGASLTWATDQANK